MKKGLSFVILLSLISVTTMFQSCKKATEPEVTTKIVTDITLNTAVSGGTIVSDGGEDITEKGVCWSTSALPTIADSRTTDGKGSAEFTSNLVGLAEGTTYYVRAYATNSVGTAYGNEETFTTGQVVGVVLTTTQATNVTSSSASTGGEVTDAGGGTVSERGVCWGTSPNPTPTVNKVVSGTGTGAFTVNLTNLEDGTLYYYRAYATNSSGTTYGQEYQILTLVTDVDGNEYKTVKIGDQVWMAENLKTTTYNDNSEIPNVTNDALWTGLSSGAYAWANNNEEINKPLYGALYNWHAVAEDKLCPEGWHVPTDEEFQALELYLGISQADVGTENWRGTDQGERIKNDIGWQENGNGTNTAGYSALPAGYRTYIDGSTKGLGLITYFWTGTAKDNNISYFRRLDAAEDGIFRSATHKEAGKSVRCIKD